MTGISDEYIVQQIANLRAEVAGGIASLSQAQQDTRKKVDTLADTQKALAESVRQSLSEINSVRGSVNTLYEHVQALENKNSLIEVKNLPAISRGVVYAAIALAALWSVFTDKEAFHNLIAFLPFIKSSTSPADKEKSDDN